MKEDGWYILQIQLCSVVWILVDFRNPVQRRRSTIITFEQKTKKDSTDLWFSTTSSLESIVAVDVLSLLLYSTSTSDNKNWI